MVKMKNMVRKKKKSKFINKQGLKTGMYQLSINLCSTNSEPNADAVGLVNSATPPES